MAPGERDGAAEIEVLRAEVGRLRAHQFLHDAVDDRLEVALREHHTLGVTLEYLLPLLGSHLGAWGAVVRTYDESLRLQTFSWSGDEERELELDLDAIFGLADADGAFCRRQGKTTLMAQALDVAGTSFGVAAIALDCELEPAQERGLAALLNGFCEILDNYLASIALARRKHHIISAVADALRTPVLGDGIDGGIDVLQRTIGFHHLAVVFRHDLVPGAESWGYRVLHEGHPIFDSNQGIGDTESFLYQYGEDLLDGRLDCLHGLLGDAHLSEHVIETSVARAEVIGRLVVARHGRDFDTFERDILSCFTDFVRQRLVDYNREWRQLATCFTQPVTKQLLRVEGYTERYLSPREREVGILFTDLTGFTRLSEQVLKKPALIGDLVDRWSARVVEIIWETGGVFDKMVGDCVIGLWGPPFFDLAAEEICERAALAAVAIREYTKSLTASPEFPALAGLEPPLGVATGLNYCPLFVGRFGPNRAYTGFSSGMNNAARLQGVAVRDEILCLDSFVRACGERGEFGDGREARVKNVAEPICFRELLGLGVLAGE